MRRSRREGRREPRLAPRSATQPRRPNPPQSRLSLSQIDLTPNTDRLNIYSCIDICGRFDYTRNHREARYPVFSDDNGEEWVLYDGPFDVAIQSLRYVVNESKREFVDRAVTALRYVDDSTGEAVHYDPFPELMCSQVTRQGAEGRDILGRWFGDVIRPTNKHPGCGYVAVARDYSCL